MRIDSFFQQNFSEFWGKMCWEKREAPAASWERRLQEGCFYFLPVAVIRMKLHTLSFFLDVFYMILSRSTLKFYEKNYPIGKRAISSVDMDRVRQTTNKLSVNALWTVREIVCECARKFSVGRPLECAIYAILIDFHESCFDTSK